uniref:Uncharacterized protein ycf20 n=1 Tax=Acrosorium ciliolatum TaxID=1550622 RepID=A0A1Z1M234_9FLOR|nr:hypothetical protein [Acrosorium ciliolatum]ARW59962.1 hypothetical protein [Acrosorium ciliolatum]
MLIIKSIKLTINYKFNVFSLHIINLMLGFFIASAISTIPAQTGDWGIISGAIIITINEILSKIIYKHNKKYILLYFINDIKIGIIYGLFVDAFKLGS